MDSSCWLHNGSLCIRGRRGLAEVGGGTPAAPLDSGYGFCESDLCLASFRPAPYAKSVNQPFKKIQSSGCEECTLGENRQPPSLRTPRSPSQWIQTDKSQVELRNCTSLQHFNKSFTQAREVGDFFQTHSSECSAQTHNNRARSIKTSSGSLRAHFMMVIFPERIKN